MEQCSEHSKVCGELGGIGANITNLTSAIAMLNTTIANLAPPIYARIEAVERKLDDHEVDSHKYREKILTTESVLQAYMKHQDEKEKRAMWQIGIVVTIINLFATAIIKTFTG
jgi:hypothetical protein